MQKRHCKTVTGGVAATFIAGLLASPAAQAALVVQTVSSAGITTEWNDAIWGTPAAVPSGGNIYQSAAGLNAANNSQLGTAGNDLTGRVRAYAGANGSPTFLGDSITIIGSTELLVKDAGTYSAAVILNGGILRFSPNAAADATITGTINVTSNSVIGTAQAAASTFTIASTLTGSSTLRLAAGQGANTITFDDGSGTSLNGFAGTLNIGGGTFLATIDFNQAYQMGLAGMTMGNFATLDRLNLDANISVASFTFGANPTLAAGTYTTTQLNGLYGNGSQFTGSGSLSVIPEPTSMLLGGISLLGLLRRRRA